VEPRRWQQLERIYHQALDQPTDARANFIARECGTDRDLFTEVKSLLVSHAKDSGFLETPVLHEAAARLAKRKGVPTGECIGHYAVIELLAVGGMGEVYRAWDQVLEREVAVKILADDIDGPAHTSARLHREGQAAARLAHPNICTVHEVGQFAERSYLVMEYVPGQTLTRVLTECSLSSQRIIQYGSAITDALAHAHQRGVLHRDLKSANVMVGESDRIKVVDFGIARRVDPASLDTGTNCGAGPSHVLAGTPAYMSPELLCGNPADVRSDLWAFGVLLYEMTAGELPFAGHTDFELAGAILHDQPRSLPESVPHALRLVIERCLAKNPGERFGSAEEIRDALMNVQVAAEFRPSLSVIATPGEQRPMNGRRSNAIAWLRSSPARLVIAGALLGAVGAGWWALHDRPESVSSVHAMPRPMLAVLPFRLEGAGLDDRHLRIGIADSIITRIAAVKALRVRPTASVVRYLRDDADAGTVKHDLGVTHVLQGIAGRVADHYELAVQLVKTDDGTVLWGDRFIVATSNLMDVEERVADRVIRGFNLGLSDRERAQLGRQSTTNTAAFEEYLKGRTAVIQIGEQAVDAAVRAFEKALELDPNYASAQAGLAMALVRRPWYASSPAESARRYQSAMRAAQRASQLDPSLAQAHEALAAVYRYSEFQWDLVVEESVRALELAPSLDLPHYNLAAAFCHLGLFDLADRAAIAGLAANPRTRPEAIRNQGRSALYDSRFETAARFLAESEQAADDGPRWMLGETWYYLGEHERSIALLKRVERSPQHAMRDRARASLAAVLAARHDRPGAEERLKTLIVQSSPDHHVSHRIGTAYAQLGRADEAVRWLRLAARTGFPCYTWFQNDPLLEPIRNHPPFVKLLGELRPMAELRRTRYTALNGPTSDPRSSVASEPPVADTADPPRSGADTIQE
jgi:serine/threonine protein kinase/TolB-like protein/Flp pilus assembly protein TadD